MHRHSGRLLLPALVAAALAAVGQRGAAQACARPCVGPANGAIMAAGGGPLSPKIYRRFVSLAGGGRARIVVIPTASTDESTPEGWIVMEALRRAGASEVLLLHTRDRTVANSKGFVAPLQEATGVWFTGGRQWRLVDAYLNTRTHRELWALLERGGVIGGTSAGASILGSYLVRGARAGNEIVMAPGYEQGFGFLRDVALDQHLLARGRENDLLKVLEKHPQLLGIGVDEGTAIIVTGDRLQVVGVGKVAVYDRFNTRPLPVFWLQPGDQYNLGWRRLVEEGRPPG